MSILDRNIEDEKLQRKLKNYINLYRFKVLQSYTLDYTDCFVKIEKRHLNLLKHKFVGKLEHGTYGAEEMFVKKCSIFLKSCSNQFHKPILILRNTPAPLGDRKYS